MPQDVTTRYDLIIIGAGPAGVEAALQAEKLGLSYLLLDKDDAGSLIKNTMGNKKFFHQYGRNTSLLKGDIAFPDRAIGDELVAAWRKQVEPLSFSPKTKVRSVRREGEFFVVETNKEPYAARRVLLTSGTFEHPRELHVHGEAGNPKVFYFLDYYYDHTGKRVVVVGGGNSATETAAYLAPDNEVLMLVRKSELAQTVTEKNRTELAQFVREGKLSLWYESSIERIEPDRVFIRRGSETVERPYDLLFIHAGFMQPFEFLEKTGVTVVDGKPVFNTETHETSIPGMYIAGALTGADSVIESANQAYDIVHRMKKGQGR